MKWHCGGSYFPVRTCQPLVSGSLALVCTPWSSPALVFAIPSLLPWYTQLLLLPPFLPRIHATSHTCHRCSCSCSSATVYPVAIVTITHTCALPLAHSLVHVWAWHSLALIVHVVVLPGPSFVATSPAAAIGTSCACTFSHRRCCC